MSAYQQQFTTTLQTSNLSALKYIGSNFRQPVSSTSKLSLSPNTKIEVSYSKGFFTIVTHISFGVEDNKDGDQEEEKKEELPTLTRKTAINPKAPKITSKLTEGFHFTLSTQRKLNDLETLQVALEEEFNGSVIVPGLYSLTSLQNFDNLFSSLRKDLPASSKSKGKLICPPEVPVIIFINEMKKHPRLLNSISFWDFLSAKDKEWEELEDFLKKSMATRTNIQADSVKYYFMRESKGTATTTSIFSIIPGVGSSDNAEKQMSILEHNYSDYMNQVFEQLKQIEDLLPRVFSKERDIYAYFYDIATELHYEAKLHLNLAENFKRLADAFLERQQYFGTWEEVLMKFQQDILYLKKYLKSGHNYLSRRGRVFAALESTQKQLSELREKKNTIGVQLTQIQKNYEEAKATEEKEAKEKEEAEKAAANSEENSGKLTIQKKPSKKPTVLLSDTLKGKADKLIEQWTQLKKEAIPIKIDELKELNRTFQLFVEFEEQTELRHFKQRVSFFLQRIIEAFCKISIILSDSESKPFLSF